MKRYVLFNITHAGFTRGQVVAYDSLEPGQRYWVDHEDILGHQRICFFCDEAGNVTAAASEPPETGQANESDAVGNGDGAPASNPDAADALSPAEVAAKNQALIDAEFGDDDEPVTGGQAVVKNSVPNKQPRCKGKTARGTRCKRINLEPNGYCSAHQDQAHQGDQSP